MLDPLDGTADEEVSLLGRTGMSARIPFLAVAEALIGAGIDVHFSGHLHVNDTAQYRNGDRFLVNVAVPALVAFPGAYKVITIGERRLDIETVGIDDMPLNPQLRQTYDREIVPSGLDAGGMLDVATMAASCSSISAIWSGGGFSSGNGRRTWRAHPRPRSCRSGGTGADGAGCGG